MSDHDDDFPKRISDWRWNFRAKPRRRGERGRPICDSCGDDWPCGYWRDEIAERPLPAPKPGDHRYLLRSELGLPGDGYVTVDDRRAS